jgi:hypothetical protein
VRKQRTRLMTRRRVMCKFSWHHLSDGDDSSLVIVGLY